MYRARLNSCGVHTKKIICLFHASNGAIDVLPPSSFHHCCRKASGSGIANASSSNKSGLRNKSSVQFPCNVRRHTVVHRKLQDVKQFTTYNENDEIDSDYLLKDPEIKKMLNEISDDFKAYRSETDDSCSAESKSGDRDSSPTDGSDSDRESAVADDFTDGLGSGFDIGSDMGSVDFEEFGEEVDYEWVLEEKESPIPLTRGTSGVFDVEELETLLRSENGQDICIIDVPKEHRYVDHMVIVSAKSPRHLRAMAEYVKLMYKKKKHQRDRFVNIEGIDSKTWMAMDLGNIALHIFMPETREFYDLETLWIYGPEFDEKSREVADPYLPYPEADFTILSHQPEYYVPEQVDCVDEHQTSFESQVYHAPSQEESLRPPTPLPDPLE